jgi:hypothetical protein
LRNIWEGGTIGEGYLRSVKSELNTGLRNNWQSMLMDNLLSNHAYNMIFENIDYLENDPHRAIVLRLKKLCKTYHTIDQCLSLPNLGLPFSAIRVNNQKFYVVCKDGNSLQIIEVNLTENFQPIFGTMYYHLNMKVIETEQISFGDILKDHDIEGILFLPCLYDGKYPIATIDNNISYCYVSSEWSQ